MQDKCLLGKRTGVRLDDMRPLLLPWQMNRWGRLAPPVSREAMQLSAELAAATYNMEVTPWLAAGWTDLTIQVDGDLTTGIDLPEEDSNILERLGAKWKLRRVRSRMRQRNPLGQVVDALRQIRESDTGKALVMAHPASDGRYVIAISFMGTGDRFYDWFSNFRLSRAEGMHKGFVQLTRQFEENEDDIQFPDTAKALGLEKLTLRQVLTEARRQDSRFVLWLSGHSQGGALMQAYCRIKLHEDGVLPSNMIGWGFASPSVMASGVEMTPENYPLYHVVNQDDLVPRFGAQVHLGLLMRYTPDDRMRSACYTWPEDEASAAARERVHALIDPGRDMAAFLIFVAAYLRALSERPIADRATGMREMQPRGQHIAKLVAAADDRVDALLDYVARRAGDAYMELLGHRMNMQLVAKRQQQITAVLDELGVKAVSQALMHLMRYPHSLAARLEKGTPAYAYIAANCFDQLMLTMPQQGMHTAAAAEGAEGDLWAHNRRLLRQQRIERSVRRYTQVHPRTVQKHKREE